MSPKTGMNDPITKIKEKLGGFSKGQKLISGYILEHYEKASYMTALKLGEAVGISESTVVRFAIELGFEGYPEMQKSLQAYTKKRSTALQRLEIADNRINKNNILQSVLNHDISQIRTTLESADSEQFELAVGKIAGADKIYIFGAMSSGLLARFLDYYLHLIFDNVILIHAADSSGIKQQLIRAGSDDTLICISFPRYSNSAAETARFAKTKGVGIVAITDSPVSPLAPLADCLLLAKSDMASFADSLVAPLALINALIVAVGMKKRGEIEKVFSELEEIWKQENVYDTGMPPN
ncbi:MAG: MurR/RpiR family transcriptional regulator [Oscillospiraceae bacterium]|nr:MurR/RpiR family transcriptional regulator [Oscillospiraceae bacterium]